MEFKHSCGAVIDITGESVGKRIECKCGKTLALEKEWSKELPYEERSGWWPQKCMFCESRPSSHRSGRAFLKKRWQDGSITIVEMGMPRCALCASVQRPLVRRRLLLLATLASALLLVPFLAAGYASLVLPLYVLIGLVMGYCLVGSFVLARRIRRMGSRPLKDIAHNFGPLDSLGERGWGPAFSAQDHGKWAIQDYTKALARLSRDIDRPTALTTLDMPEVGPVVVSELPKGEWPQEGGLWVLDIYVRKLGEEIVSRWGREGMQTTWEDVGRRAGEDARRELASLWYDIGGWTPKKEAE